VHLCSLSYLLSEVSFSVHMCDDLCICSVCAYVHVDPGYPKTASEEKRMSGSHQEQAYTTSGPPDPTGRNASIEKVPAAVFLQLFLSSVCGLFGFMFVQCSIV
jgi:hypothetical protein